MKTDLLMRCRSVYDILDDYLEGEMNFLDRLLLRGHLMMCPRCRHYLRQYRRVWEVTGRPRPEQLPADFEQVLGRVLTRWKEVASGGESH